MYFKMNFPDCLDNR